MTRRAAVLLFLLYLTTAFVLTHLPGENVPKIRWADWIPAADKVVHAGLYYFLAAFLANCLRFRLQSNRAIVAATMAVLAGYAAFDEWSQQFSPHRSPDFYDFVADMIGAWFGVSTFVVCRWYRKRRIQPKPVPMNDGSELEPDPERTVRPATPSVGSDNVKVHSPA
ncbi:MAG: VanZ family protein [Pirellulaceae bacterium]|nr:VanZ family protein [Pirellulaceae bacterium]